MKIWLQKMIKKLPPGTVSYALNYLTVSHSIEERGDTYQAKIILYMHQNLSKTLHWTLSNQISVILKFWNFNNVFTIILVPHRYTSFSWSKHPAACTEKDCNQMRKGPEGPKKKLNTSGRNYDEKIIEGPKWSEEIWDGPKALYRFTLILIWWEKWDST